jgi:hypothetical protein
MIPSRGFHGWNVFLCGNVGTCSSHIILMYNRRQLKRPNCKALQHVILPISYFFFGVWGNFLCVPQHYQSCVHSINRSELQSWMFGCRLTKPSLNRICEGNFASQWNDCGGAGRGRLLPFIIMMGFRIYRRDENCQWSIHILFVSGWIICRGDWYYRLPLLVRILIQCQLSHWIDLRIERRP